MPAVKTFFVQSIPILLGLGIVVLLLLRIEVASGRFFDVDEFTHMHWAAQIFMGEKPYIDFFTFFPPGYHWMLQPLFILFGDSSMIFIAGRYLSILGFVGILVVLGIFFGRLRSLRYALLPVLILSFLPMPYDKYFEIRPDTWSTFLGFLGVLLLSIGWSFIRKKEKAKRNTIRALFFAAGVLFSVCLLVLPKMLPFVIVAGFVEAGRTAFQFWKQKKEIRKKKKELILLFEPLMVLLAGGGGIAGLFFLWMVSLGNFGEVWYSLTKQGIEGNQIGKYFIMEPHLFFFPNSSFYGGEGITLSYIVNHAIWFFAIIVGAIRLVTPFLAKNSSILDEVALSGIFITSVYGYIYYFPLKHTQYLIPVAVFIAFYAADGIEIIIRKIKILGYIGVIGLIIIGFLVNRELNARKLWWKNSAQMAEYDLLHKTVPKDAVVVDLEGKLLYWKHGYYVCCLAFGQFGGYLSRPLPNFTESLIKHNVEYIYQGDSGRLSTILPEDLAYVITHYAPVEGWNGKLFVRKK